MRIAILHDYIDKAGGGERVVLELAKALKADIITGYFVPDKTYKKFTDYKILQLSKETRNPLLRAIRLYNAFHSFTPHRAYDYYILSGSYSIAASPNLRPNMAYCHTPPRFLYDLKEYYISKANIIEKIGLWLLRKYMKNRDPHYLSSCQRIVVNSKNVQRRIQSYYDDETYNKTTVVYPPINTKKFRWKGKEDYYLSYGRLDKLKRVDVIIDAFKKLPSKQLIICSAGPELNNLKSQAQGYDNIQILGRVPDTILTDLVGKCKAVIYLPENEDFGMTPLEANSAGKPCIGSNEGGLRETIVPGVTGWLIEPTANSLIKCIHACEQRQISKQDCIDHARSFDSAVFIKKITSIMNGEDNAS